ncbi:ABC transporter permease [Segnochrobactrum spirostomi]|uniref:ABC transporter permease n=1 Tax=Segnochrobactrum spirostomi TaxID=2608987 RepID=A0A6A7YAP1_9HYPH|nr:ABC transporter permease [Segnochrobactrum spirostomi]MQT14732.1 ABC transporter permease [Segnochrobactrum spirostomi]
MNRLDPRRDLAVRFAFMLLVYAAFALKLPAYYSVAGIASLLDGAFLTGIIALGVGLTMIAGEMDLSVGSMAALAGIVSIKLAAIGIIPAICLTALLAALVGALQGWCIAWLRINSLIFTVGTLIAFRGLALLLSGEQTANIPLDELESIDFLDVHWGFLSPLSLTLFAVALLLGLLATTTIWCREIFAIGGGRAEARAAGVPTRRPIVLAFALSGGLAGLAGAFLSLEAGSATPLGYEAVLLDAVTACLIGGVALQGGRGSVLGILVGLFTLRFLVSGIASLGAPFWAQSLASGALLITLILAEGGYSAWARRRAFSRRLSVDGSRT